MLKLLIIADDCTGALDTGVQFAAYGSPTKVVIDTSFQFSQTEPETEVLVLDAETRHLTPEEAFQIIYRIVSAARQHGIAHIYLKTDSALRGNVGSQLAAALSAAQCKVLHFIPALPRMNRITREGIHYIDGLPVQQSVFGHDPFDPVQHSSISELIATQSSVRVETIPVCRAVNNVAEPVIAAYDALTDDDIQSIAERLKRTDDLAIMAGCAGFASFLPQILDLSRKEPVQPLMKDHFLVVCGSLNPITLAQLDYAEQAGFYRIRLTAEQKLAAPEQKLDQSIPGLSEIVQICHQESMCIIDSNNPDSEQEIDALALANEWSLEKIRQAIATNLGRTVHSLLDSGLDCTLLLTGGDTLLGFLKEAQVSELYPICELAPGTVLSSIQLNGKTYEIISKSGGFGDEDLMVVLAGMMLEKSEVMYQ